MKGQLKKIELLEAGLNILHMKGYNGTSINDIVQAAEVPKGSFYFYYKSKEDFALAAIDHFVRDTNDVLLEILNNQSKTAIERLNSFYDYRIDLNRDSMSCSMGCFVSNMANELGDSNDRIREKTKYYFDQTIEHLVKIFEEARTEGSISNNHDLRAMVYAIEDAWRGALTSMKVFKNEEPLINFKEIILSQFLK